MSRKRSVYASSVAIVGSVCQSYVPQMWYQEGGSLVEKRATAQEGHGVEWVTRGQAQYMYYLLE